MKINYQKKEIKSIDLLPLINVVFLLILFVLIAGRPTTDHPKAVQVASSAQETDYSAGRLAINLLADNSFSVKGRDGLTLGEVKVAIEETGLAESGAMVTLIADRDATAEALLDFRKAMAQIGIGEIRLKTKYQAPASGGDK